MLGQAFDNDEIIRHLAQIDRFVNAAVGIIDNRNDITLVHIAFNVLPGPFDFRLSLGFGFGPGSTFRNHGRQVSVENFSRIAFFEIGTSVTAKNADFEIRVFTDVFAFANSGIAFIFAQLKSVGKK